MLHAMTKRVWQEVFPRHPCNAFLAAGQFVRTQAEDLSMSSAVLAQGVVGLVVACRQYPNNVTRAMLPFLKPGNPFVVFSPYKEVNIGVGFVANCLVSWSSSRRQNGTLTPIPSQL